MRDLVVAFLRLILRCCLKTVTGARPLDREYPKWRTDATMWLQFSRQFADQYIEMRMRGTHLSMRTEGITAFLKRIRRCSVDGRKRYESVDVNLFDKGAKTALFSFENGLVWTGRQLKETNVSAIVIPSLHLRKHMKTRRKYVFSMFSLTYSGLLNV